MSAPIEIRLLVKNHSSQQLKAELLGGYKNADAINFGCDANIEIEGVTHWYTHILRQVNTTAIIRIRELMIETEGRAMLHLTNRQRTKKTEQAIVNSAIYTPEQLADMAEINKDTIWELYLRGKQQAQIIIRGETTEPIITRIEYLQSLKKMSVA